MKRKVGMVVVGYGTVLVHSMTIESNCIALSPETCPPLNLSDGMVPSSENHTVGTVITFSCNPGKQVSEDIATACFPGGNWSTPNLPTCVDGT